MAQHDIAEIDPLDHHYIKEGLFSCYQRDRATLDTAAESGQFSNPYGWDYKAAQRAVLGQWQNAYKEDVRRAAILMEAERARPKTKGEQWHAQAQDYFHDIEDKVLTAIAAEMYRQWLDERAAKAKASKAERAAEVKRVGETLTAHRLTCEASGASIVGPTRTVTSSRIAHSPSMMAPTFAPAPFAPTHHHAPPPPPPPAAYTMAHHTHAPPAMSSPMPPVGFGTFRGY
eukprot:TRINITY_DN56462_c0_g1_i1.p1 TRINITY_DN56462_c0_g1~~TRINITY_DN56462_c0_g1_i1.p1  ORF type:complete len:229 (+),score=35.68 TRINITY_DN56462_c0_g1_i1:135-821(+)